jgi:hypothetical protein
VCYVTGTDSEESSIDPQSQTMKSMTGLSGINADHLLNCRKLDSSAQTAGDTAKLYWDARFLMG